MNNLIRHFFRRLKKNQRGAAMLEFAIIVPILLLLVLGMLEFGWLLTGWTVVTGAAREGARGAVVWESIEQINARVENHTDLLPFQNVIANPSIGSPGEETSVIVTGDLPLLVGFFPLADPFTIRAEATMRQEFERQY